MKQFNKILNINIFIIIIMVVIFRIFLFHFISLFSVSFVKSKTSSAAVSCNYGHSGHL